MDQMNAHVYKLHGQIYRRNVPLEKISQWNYTTAVQLSDAYEDDELSDDCITTAGIEENENSDDELNSGKPSTEKPSKFNFVKYDQKRKIFYTKMEVPSRLIGSALGSKNNQKTLIQACTSTKIILPKRNDNSSGVIEIQGDLAHLVDDARGRLELELIKARQKCPPTHFVSISLAKDANFSQMYNKFVDMIFACSDIPEECKNPDIFRPVEKLHLTLSVLRLYTEEDERVVKKCISDMFEQELSEVLANDSKVVAEISKLGFFGADANSANVVYAKVKSEKLQKLANIIDENLTIMGFASKRRTKDVLLHMTILNTKYAKDTSRKNIDVSELLKLFGRFDFPPVDINEVRICIMHEVDPYTNGYPTIFSHTF